MGKSRLVIGILIVVCIILCMFTIYKHTQYNNMRIAYNIKDRESITLKEDYEKLYKAYYEYDKKVLEILKFSDKVYWAEDSSGYVIKDGKNLFFSFFKKGQIEIGSSVWLSSQKEVDSNHTGKYFDFGPSDSLKSHQFRFKVLEGWERAIIVSPMVSLKTGNFPTSKSSCTISFGE